MYIFNVKHQEQPRWCGAIQMPNLLLLLILLLLKISINKTVELIAYLKSNGDGNWAINLHRERTWNE